MTLTECKLRRLAGQHLLAPDHTQTVVKDLCGVQAQFMSHALHALAIRCDAVDTSALLKNWTLRGTAHVFAADDLPLFIRPETYRLNDWSIPTWWNQRNLYCKKTFFRYRCRKNVPHPFAQDYQG